MDLFDLTTLQSNQPETEEIEHWCPVCDRLVPPTNKFVARSQLDQTPNPTSDNETAKAATNATSPVTEAPPTPTTPTFQRSATSSPISRRKSGQGHPALRTGGRPALYRSKTSMVNATTGFQHKRKPDHANRSNPNFVSDFVVPVQKTGAAPRTKTSPMGNTSHLANANVDDDLHGEAGTILGTKHTTSDRPAEPQSRESVPPVKRKSSVPDVNAGPRLKPLTKSKSSGKPRPKSLNLVLTQVNDSKGVTTTKSSRTPGTVTPTAAEPQTPPTAATCPRYTVEDLRRRLYCSEECYNVDLKGEKLDVYQLSSPSRYDSPTSGSPALTTPTLSPSDTPQKLYEVKRNLSCEMPWLWTNTISRNSLSRRMAPTRTPSWLASGEEDMSEDNQVAVSEEPLSGSPSFPQPKTGPVGILPRRGVLERKQSKTLHSHQVTALNVVSAFDGQRSPDLIYSPVDNAHHDPADAPMRKARPFSEHDKNEHRLFFRRMPGKIDGTLVTMPPAFVDGKWAETPPPGFDYAAFMEDREKERKRRQIEITEAMLLKKNVDDLSTGEEVTGRPHELGRRKKRVDADKSRYERRIKTMHGTGYFHEPQPGKHHQPWWHLDEREDWKTYWAARDGGLEDCTFEQWQLKRHAERVEHAEREQALKRIEGERRRVQEEISGVRAAGDGRKVAKRPLLIRVATQPTVSDVDLVGQFYKEGETKLKQRKERVASIRMTRTSSSSLEASPLVMNRSKALPVLHPPVDPAAEQDQTVKPSNFMRDNTLCIPGFVVAEAEKKSDGTPTSPATARFAFPLVPVSGTVDPPAANMPDLAGLATIESKSPSKSFSPRVSSGLAYPATGLTSSVPRSPLGTSPDLVQSETLRASPQLKSLDTLVNPTVHKTAIPNDALPEHLPLRRRIQSLNGLTLTLSDLPKASKLKRSSLVLPRSPLGLHSFSAAELPEPKIRGEGPMGAENIGRVGVNPSNTPRSKQAEIPSGSHRRTLPPLVINETVTASLSPVSALSADVVMGSPEVVTATSGAGSGSGSSGEESTWSRGEVLMNRSATVKGTSATRIPRIPPGLTFTQVRPRSMGPIELLAPASVPASHIEASSKAEAGSPLSYSTSFLRLCSEFRGGNIPGGTKSPSTSTAAHTSSTGQSRQVEKRRSLWGLFGSTKP